MSNLPQVRAKRDPETETAAPMGVGSGGECFGKVLNFLLKTYQKTTPDATPWPYIGTPAERAELFKVELLAAALEYAAKGYPVLPVRLVNGRKLPLVKWGKGVDGHPDLKKRRATTDPDTIRAWWARWPLAMIGMPTGARSGVVVLDVDRKGGVDGLANLPRAGVDPYRLTLIVARTPSGGLHFFMKYSGPIRNTASFLAAGVDIRGDGGMIVLPPSLPSIDRDEYQWESHYGAL